MSTTILAPIALCVLGIVFGAILAVAAKVFAVEKDPREEAIAECLPGANCGGCGYPGCSGYAAAIVAGKAPVNACSPGGAEVANEIGKIMGVEVEVGARKIAQVMCTGGGHNKTRYDYVGLESCLAVTRVSSGPLQCSYGCLGGGDCVEACKFDAIHVVDGVAKVDFEKCVACGACVDACPKHIIRIVPLNSKKYTEIPCASHDKGPVVRQACDNGCIGCKLCEKACPREGAIVIENFLAKINYDICIGCGLCVSICPEVFEIGDDGLAQPIQEVTETLEKTASQARESCPVNAIDLE